MVDISYGYAAVMCSGHMQGSCAAVICSGHHSRRSFAAIIQGDHSQRAFTASIHGGDMQVWFRHGFGMVPAWFRHGSGDRAERATMRMAVSYHFWKGQNHPVWEKPYVLALAYLERLRRMEKHERS